MVPIKVYFKSGSDQGSYHPREMIGGLIGWNVDRRFVSRTGVLGPHMQTMELMDRVERQLGQDRDPLQPSMNPSSFSEPVNAVGDAGAGLGGHREPGVGGGGL